MAMKTEVKPKAIVTRKERVIKREIPWEKDKPTKLKGKLNGKSKRKELRKLWPGVVR